MTGVRCGLKASPFIPLKDRVRGFERLPLNDETAKLLTIDPSG